MRNAPNAAPSTAELDRVKRVLFPTNGQSDEERDEEFRSLPPTEEEGANGDELFESLAEEEEEEEDEDMSWEDEEGRKTRNGECGIAVVSVEGVFRLDPDVEVFRESDKPEPTAGTSSTAGAVSSTRGDSSATGASSSPHRFDPPFKTPPSESTGAKLTASSPLSTSEGTAHLGEKTPPYKTPPKSPGAPRGKGERRIPPNFTIRFGSPKFKALAKSPSARMDTTSTTTMESGKRKLFTVSREPVEELPSPKKKTPQSNAKMPKVMLTMATLRPSKSAVKGPAPKKEKRETAKGRAEAFRVTNRDAILRDMDEQKSQIDDLLEKRRRRKCLRQSQDSPSNECAE